VHEDLRVVANGLTGRSEKDGWDSIKTILICTIGFLVIISLALTLFFFYVQSVKTDINKAKDQTTLNKDLNNQGRATICFLAATRVGNVASIPKICFSPDVMQYYNPYEAQKLSKDRDTAASTQAICMLLPDTPKCMSVPKAVP
jgi:hypothetical protein